MRALGIEVNGLKHLSSELLNKRWIVGLLLRRHDWELKFGRGRTTCLRLIKRCSIQQIHRPWFQNVLDLKSKGRGSWCWARDGRGGFGSDCRAQLSPVALHCGVVMWNGCHCYLGILWVRTVHILKDTEQRKIVLTGISANVVILP